MLTDILLMLFVATIAGLGFITYAFLPDLEMKLRNSGVGRFLRP